MSEAYSQPAQPKPTSPVAWILIGCGVLVFGFIAFIAFIFFVVIGSMRTSTPYKDAVSAAQSDPRVVAALGRPVTIGLFVSGSINTQDDAGQANLAIPISGPNGKAKIHVVGEKKRGRWSYSDMIVTPDKGPEIDLLNASPPESPGTSPPAE